jgi:hypothetical protein
MTRARRSAFGGGYARDHGLILDPHLDFDNALNHARDLALDLEAARDHARTNAPDHALDRDLDRDLDRALDRALGLAHTLDRDRDRGLYLELDHALEYVLAVVLAIDSDPDYSRNLERIRAGARDLAQDLHLIRRLIRVQATEYQESIPRSAESPEPVRVRRVTASAVRLAGAAARLLPAGERARFGEEYRSELWDLAQAGAGRRQQLGYATRQLGRTAPLRLAVLAPRSRKQPG